MEMMRQIAIAVFTVPIVLGIQCDCLAQETRPRKLSSETATTAIDEFNGAERKLVKKRDSAKKQISQTYENEHAKLRDALVSTLQASLQEETKKGNLDSAIEIRDAVLYFKKLTPEISGSNKVKPDSRSIAKSLRQELEQLKEDLARAPREVPARFSVINPVSVAVVTEGEKIYTNRNYKWKKIPPVINGWIFTKHAIRTSQTYEIDVTQEGFVIVCYSTSAKLDRPRAFYDRGWTRISDLQLGLDNDENGWVFARKHFAKGRHQIPLGHPHSGTVLLSPAPNNSR